MDRATTEESLRRYITGLAFCNPREADFYDWFQEKSRVFFGRRAVGQRGAEVEAWVKRKRPRAKECYKNSQNMTVSLPVVGLSYYEGLAIMEYGVPIHHAWVVDHELQVIDVTLDAAARVSNRLGWTHHHGHEVCYLGVDVPTATVLKNILDTEQWTDMIPYYWNQIKEQQPALLGSNPKLRPR